ncbi:hypothetical protein ACN2C7_10900 [Caulobacter sp. ErkDOM-E]|uniref:hypothetical protein n=1 Tax=Caulobacter sp. ErkDOM-E TaxID=3402778 RepID=UPI003AF8E39B
MIANLTLLDLVAVAVLVIGAFFIGWRASALDPKASGFPAAHWIVRAAIDLVAIALAFRAALVLFAKIHVQPADLFTYAAVAVSAVALLANVVRQRPPNPSSSKAPPGPPRLIAGGRRD